MKTIQFSVDRAEWTRYYYEIEVEDNLSPEEIKEAAIEAVENCDVRECGTKCLGNAEIYSPQYNWPEDLS